MVAMSSLLDPYFDPYFVRISFTGPTEPTLNTLRGVVAAHNRSIPFENLDPLTGVPVVDLSAKALAVSWISVYAESIRGRGGSCPFFICLEMRPRREIGRTTPRASRKAMNAANREMAAVTRMLNSRLALMAPR